MSNRNWLWATRGKHPSAKDYFSLGHQFPPATYFSDWIGKGYPLLTDRGQSVDACSWRFWARGAVKNEIVCGLIRDSHDSLGRPYPLLILGTGLLPSWEERWDKLPSACERAWRQMEYISMQRFQNIGQLEIEMLRIAPPCFECFEPSVIQRKAEGQAALSQPDSSTAAYLDTELDRLFPDDTGSIGLGSEGSFDSLLMMLHINSALKGKLNRAPNALFMGGTFNRSYLVYFSRPMKTDDFTNLWSTHKQ